MAIVSLATAKQHLRIPAEDTDHDADIAIKMAQAEAIILDYLKTRTIAIASVSVANPTVITTSVPHSLVSGVTAPILGTTTTPTVNGAQVITVTSPTTFTIPIDVTVGQADAAGTVGSPAWTEATAPGPVSAAILLMLTRLYEHRGDMEEEDADLWSSLERLLARQRDPALA
jgi:hypothetical protein